MKLRLLPPRWIALMQGVYFFITGIWPLLHIESFMTVTGGKNDLWLVKVVGILAAVIGAVLISGSFRKPVSVETMLLGTLSAAGLLAADLVYVSTGTISAVYLLDAALEIIFAVLWLAASSQIIRAQNDNGNAHKNSSG